MTRLRINGAVHPLTIRTFMVCPGTTLLVSFYLIATELANVKQVVIFDATTAVLLRIQAFWDVTPCGWESGA
jgi:hypothetical protein